MPYRPTMNTNADPMILGRGSFITVKCAKMIIHKVLFLEPCSRCRVKEKDHGD
jgi:hypothetical protein